MVPQQRCLHPHQQTKTSRMTFSVSSVNTDSHASRGAAIHCGIIIITIQVRTVNSQLRPNPFAPPPARPAVFNSAIAWGGAMNSHSVKTQTISLIRLGFFFLYCTFTLNLPQKWCKSTQWNNVPGLKTLKGWNHGLLVLALIDQVIKC